MAVSLDFAPGTRYGYSNLGYCVLTLVIEKVWSDHKGSEHSYGQVVQTLLLDPAGISKVEMYLGENDAKEHEAVAQCAHRCGRDGYYPGASNSGLFSRRLIGDGGWVASTEALMKLVRAVTTPDCDKGRCLLSESSRGLLSIWHSGSLPGTRAYMSRKTDATTTSWAITVNGELRCCFWLADLVKDWVKNCFTGASTGTSLRFSPSLVESESEESEREASEESVLGYNSSFQLN